MPRFKQNFSFICPQMKPSNEFSVLDCLKVCDSVLFVASAAFNENEMVDKLGHKILSMALAQGVPLSIVAVMDLESVVPKKRSQIKTDFQKLINKVLPDDKVMSLETNADGFNILR
jgi:pre-rRNA-processing protein TSR1